MDVQAFGEVLNKLIEAQDHATWWGAIIAALGAMIGAALAVGIPVFLAWRNSPILHLSHSMSVDVFDFDFEHNGAILNRRYATVQLENQGKTVAKNVRLYLAKLEKIHQAADPQDVPLGSSFQLAWPGWTFEGKEVPVGISLAIEVVSVDKSEPGWIFQFREKERNQVDVRSYKGTYQITLVAVADNAKPLVRKLTVDYNGDWHQFQPTGLHP